MRKLTPYKILVHVLYGSYEFVSWTGNRVSLENGPFSTFFGIHPNRLKEYIVQLEEASFIEQVEREWGKTTFEVRIPDRLKEVGLTLDNVRGK